MRKTLLFISLVLFCLACTKEAAIINIPPPPVIKYTELSPGVFQFTADGVGIINYSWSFGDNKAVSNEPNPSYTYRFNGSYKVILIAQIKSGEYQKTETVNTEVSVKSLKESTPKFVTALDKNETTVTFTNPSAYVKKVDWEIVDLYDEAVVKSGNNLNHTFRWNGEHTVKMTATVEDKNGDTTYTDVQTVKILGNPPPSIAPLVNMSYAGTNGTHVYNYDSNLYFSIEVSSGDPDNEDVKLFKPNHGVLNYIQVQYYHNYPHSGPFPLKLKCTNPNGTTTFTYEVPGIPNVPYIENVNFTIPQVNVGLPDIKTNGSLVYNYSLSNQRELINIGVSADNGQIVDPVYLASFGISAFQTNSYYHKDAQVTVEFQQENVDFSKMIIYRDLNLNEFAEKKGNIKAAQGSPYYIRIKPVNKKYIYIPYGDNRGKKWHYCTTSVTINASAITFAASGLTSISDYPSRESDDWYRNIFRYLYEDIMLGRLPKNHIWYYYTDFDFDYYKL